ncbi:MAG: UDP-glucose 4-epimerase GalE [Sporolactobacillus sp.]
MAILVLGAAGYIGSHMVDTLVNDDQDVVAVDNLGRGHQSAVNRCARFYQGDVRDKAFMGNVFSKEKIDAVIHFCAYSIIPESLKEPLKYFDNNVSGLITLLEVMNQFSVKKLVFSSSAAVYGVPHENSISENEDKNPINPYGQTKLMMEKIMKWADKAYGIKWVALRYFNVAGAKLDGSIGEDHRPESHLIPIVLQAALGIRDHVDRCGNDYQTRDGYNVRDYVHVLDLTNAHVLALHYLNDGGQSIQFNVGSSHGFTVKEIIDAARRVTHKKIVAVDAPRRGGDPDSLVADSSKIESVLNWKRKYGDMDTIIGSAWNWMNKHPNGFED